MNLVNVGHWSLFIGMILAILAAFISIPYIAVVLFLLGLIVGFLNISETESTPFLTAVIALLVIGIAGMQVPDLSDLLVVVLNNFIAFMSAAGLVVAIKQVLTMSKPAYENQPEGQPDDRF